MPPASEQARFRILALHPHPRHIGQVVLDEDGLVSGGTLSCRTKRFASLDGKMASLEQLVAASLERYEPTVIVIVRSSGCPWVGAMVARAIELADASGLPVRIQYEAALVSLFVDEDIAAFDKLGQSVTSIFFPELASGIKSWGRGHGDSRRHRRSTWKAAAGALGVLADMRPAAVRRLAREPIPSGLSAFLARGEHPLTV